MTILIPEAALESHVAILGKTGSGKSNLAKVVAEDLMAVGERICVVDPKGDWWGLRLARSGKKPSPFRPLIFGGRHGDLALAEHHGAVLAEAICSSSDSVIIDTRLMTVGQRTRFFIDFAETLLRVNHGPLRLILDEAHLFAPKGKVNDVKAGMMLSATNNLASLGRGIGLRLMFLSQRPAKLHNDTLSQCETLIAMRLILPHDREAIGDWIKDSADPAQGREIMASLPALPTGDAWVWAPQLDHLQRVHVPLASTFDSGKAPARGEVAPSLTPIDVQAMGARMDSIRQEVQANDPAKLRKRIAELEQAAKVPAKSAPPDPSVSEKAHQRGFDEGYKAGKDFGGRKASHNQMVRVVDSLAGAAMLNGDGDALVEALARMRQIEIPESVAAPPLPKAPPVNRAPEKVAPSQPVSHNAGNGDAAISGAMQRVIDSIAWWHSIGFADVPRAHAAVTAGYSPNASTFGVYYGKLAALGLVETRSAGCIGLTDAGRAAANAPADTNVLHAAMEKLSNKGATVLRKVADAYPDAISRGELADQVGLSRTASTLGVYLGESSRLGFVENAGTGMVRAADFLFAGQS